MPLAYTAAAILVANFTDNELLQLGTFFALLLIIVIRKHDSRIPIAYALIMLIISAFQLAFQTGSSAWIDPSGFWGDLLLSFQFAFLTETAANKTVILAYYLLSVGVIAQLIEYMRNPEVEEHSNE